MHTGARRYRAGAYKNRTNTIIWTKRSINSYHRAAGMLLFYLRPDGREIEGMDSLGECPVDQKRIRCRFLEKGTHQRAEAVSDDPVSADTEDNRAWTAVTGIKERFSSVGLNKKHVEILSCKRARFHGIPFPFYNNMNFFHFIQYPGKVYTEKNSFFVQETLNSA